MALRWLEAGLACQNATLFGRLYTNVSGAVDGTYTDQFGRTPFESDDLSMRTPAVVGAVENTWIIGFGFRVTSGQLDSSPSAVPHIGLRSAAGEQLRLEIVDATETKPGGASYKIRVMRGATELARTVERFVGLSSTGGRRTYFEFKAVVRTGTNGSFELRYHDFKNGQSTATWDAANTGINTANQGADGADRFELAWTTGSLTDLVSYTDITICDGTGAKNNDYLGPIYMEALKPAGNGNSLQWDLAGSASSIEDALNEVAGTQTLAEDDKRITADIVGLISLATMSNLSLIQDTTIVGMQVRTYGKMDTVGSRDVQFFYRKTTGSPAQIGTGILDLDTTSIVGEADTQENDPNTGTDWVIADINAIEIGVELDA